MLEILEARKSYHGTSVLYIPMLNLGEGLYWIRGVNGSGKTTLLKMIAGLLPFEGEIVLRGINQHVSPASYRRLVSWAEAEPLYPSFITGKDLVSFYKEVRKAQDSQVTRLISLLEIQSFLHRPLGDYSAGMVKRLSLLLAFIGDMPLILLDEPLATLDAEGSARLPELIREYREERGVSFIFSSHQSLVCLCVDRKFEIGEKTIYPSA